MMKHSQTLSKLAIVTYRNQFAQTGGVVFRQGSVRKVYTTLSDAVEEHGTKILNARFYRRLNTDVELLYFTGTRTEADQNYRDIGAFHYNRRKSDTQKVPLTPISVLEQELEAMLPQRQN